VYSWARSPYFVKVYKHMRFDEEYYKKQYNFEKNEEDTTCMITVQGSNRNSELIFNFINKD